MKNKRVLIAVVAALIVAGAITLVLWTRPDAPIPELRIAVLTDLTSYTAEYGQQERAALEVLAARVNATGGVQGRSVRLEVEDTKGTPKEAVNALNKILASPPEPSLLFSALSSVSMAVLPIADQQGIPTLCNATSGRVVTSSTLGIRNFPDPGLEIETTIERAARPLGLERLGLLYINDEYGNSIATALPEYLAAEEGMDLVLAESYDFSTTSFRPLAAKLVDAGADSVYCVGYGSQVASLFQQLRDTGFAGRLLVPSLIVNTDGVFGQSASLLEGVIFNGFDYQQESEELRSFLGDFEARYSGRQSDIGVLAYVGMKLVLDNSHSPDGSASDLFSALQEGSPFQTIVGAVTFEARSFVYPMEVYVVENGKIDRFVPPKNPDPPEDS